MALKRDALKTTVANDKRDVAKDGPRLPMKPYMVKFPEDVMDVFSAFCRSRGLSMSAGIRQAVMQYMEREGLR